MLDKSPKTKMPNFSKKKSIHFLNQKYNLRYPILHDVTQELLWKSILNQNLKCILVCNKGHDVLQKHRAHA